MGPRRIFPAQRTMMSFCKILTRGKLKLQWSIIYFSYSQARLSIINVNAHVVYVKETMRIEDGKFA